jgi:hypothetical protein
MNPGCKLAVVVLTALLPLAAAAQPATTDEAARLAREALERMMGALGSVMSSIPQYSAPEILPNGDIIIRRKPRADSPPEAPVPPDQRKT